MGVIEWTGDRSHEEVYLPEDPAGEGFSTLVPEILDALRGVEHPTRHADIVSLGIVRASDAIDGRVDITGGRTGHMTANGMDRLLPPSGLV